MPQNNSEPKPFILGNNEKCNGILVYSILILIFVYIFPVVYAQHQICRNHNNIHLPLQPESSSIFQQKQDTCVDLFLWCADSIIYLTLCCVWIFCLLCFHSVVPLEVLWWLLRYHNILFSKRILHPGKEENPRKNKMSAR